MAIVALVEDEPEYIAQFTAILQAAKHKVYVYRDPASARQGLSERNFDALLLDLKLDGDETAGHKLLRDLPEEDRPPRVLVISNLPDVHIWRPVMLGGGAWDYLEKSVEISTLEIKLARLLENSPNTAPNVRVGSISWPADRICEMTWRGDRLGMPYGPALLVTALVKASPNVVRQKDLLALMDAPKPDNLFTQIRNARSLFEAFDPDFNAIQTVHGTGYRWKE